MRPLILFMLLGGAVSGQSLLQTAQKAAAPAGSQSTPSDAPAPAPDALGRTNPRGTLTGFVRAYERHDYGIAAEYLQDHGTSRRNEASQEELARKLGAILDSEFNVNLAEVSAQPDGRQRDGMPEDQENLGTVDIGPVPMDVILVRVTLPDQTRVWVFSHETLKEVPAVFEHISAFSVNEQVPAALQRKIVGIEGWRWLKLIVVLILAWLASKAFEFICRWVFSHLAGRFRLHFDGPKEVRLLGPIFLFLVGMFMERSAFSAATFYKRQFWHSVGLLLSAVAITWLLFRVIDLWVAVLRARQDAKQVSIDQSFLWVIDRAGKMVAVTAFALMLLKLAGIELTAVLTGLGIGGVALAFAAQKTIENLFGGAMLVTDRPLKIGDYCKFAGYAGTVVDIGIRSTRIRTNERTIVSVPNGQTAAVSLENFSARDKFLLQHVIGLRYESGPGGIRAALDAIRGLLLAHPSIEKPEPRVRFIRLGASSLDVEIFAYILAPDFSQFLAKQEEILLSIMEVVEKLNLGIAFPSQTLYVQKEAAAVLDAAMGLADEEKA